MRNAGTSAGKDSVTLPTAPARRPPLLEMVANVCRHSWPIALLYLHGNIASYLLLTAYDLSLGLVLIGLTIRSPGDRGTVDPRSRWLISRLIEILVLSFMLGILGGIVAVPILAPALLLGMLGGVDWHSLVAQPVFWIPIGGMSLLAACEFQLSFESRTTPGPRGAMTQNAPVIGDPIADRRRSLAARASQVALLGTFVALCIAMSLIGRWGLYAFPAIFTALLIFYDARPDVAHRIFPDPWGST